MRAITRIIEIVWVNWQKRMKKANRRLCVSKLLPMPILAVMNNIRFATIDRQKEKKKRNIIANVSQFFVCLHAIESVTNWAFDIASKKYANSLVHFHFSSSNSIYTINKWYFFCVRVSVCTQFSVRRVQSHHCEMEMDATIQLRAPDKM